MPQANVESSFRKTQQEVGTESETLFFFSIDESKAAWTCQDYKILKSDLPNRYRDLSICLRARFTFFDLPR